LQPLSARSGTASDLMVRGLLLQRSFATVRKPPANTPRRVPSAA